MAREEKRREILQAAGRIFYYNGFEGTRIDDVAKEAGIGKGTVYEYFSSKQELFEEMVAYHREQHLENLRGALAGEGTFRGKFIALARYHAEVIQEHAGVFHQMANSTLMSREMGAQLLEQNLMITEIFKGLVLEAIEKGELRSDVDPEIVAAVVLGTVSQYCCKKVMFNHNQGEEINFQEVVDTVMRGLQKS